MANNEVSARGHLTKPAGLGPLGTIARAITMVVGLVLLLWGTLAIAGAQGVPDVVMGMLVVGTSLLAIPAVSRIAARRFPTLSRSFGPLLAMTVMTVISVACFFVGVSLEKQFDPRTAAAREARAAKFSRDRQQASEKRQADAHATQLRETAKKAQSAREERTAVEQDFNRLWASVTSALGPCEDAQQSLGDQLRNGAFSAAAYREAESGRRSCFSAYRELQGLSPPSGISSDSEATTKAGLESCASAAMARMTFFDIASDIIDGERQPSRLAAAQAQNEAAKAATLQCAARIIDGAGKAGVKITQN